MALIHRDAPYPHWEFQDPHSGDLLRLVPERGGLISGWRCQGQEILYLDEARFADPGLSVRGGIPVLFPICGGLPGDRLPLPQGDFTLRQHGFARDLPWRLEPLPDGEGVAMDLDDGPTTRAAYPFGFQLRLEARLAGAALDLKVRIRHSGSGAIGTADTTEMEGPLSMPFSFGLHPYLAISGLESLALEGLPADCLDHLTMAPAATAAQLERLAQGIDLLTRPTGPVRLRDRGNGRLIELQGNHPWDLVVLWSEPPRPMVCLEPWTGPRQALLSGDRRLELSPGAALELNARLAVLDAGH